MMKITAGDVSRREFVWMVNHADSSPNARALLRSYNDMLAARQRHVEAPNNMQLAGDASDAHVAFSVMLEQWRLIRKDKI